MLKVTAIMPVRGRTEFALQALASFMSQTHAEKELIILQDADMLTFENHQIPHGVILATAAERWPISRKRNWLCERAEDSVICHWDSDDWSAPGRMVDQVERLESSGRAVTGYHTMLFFDGTRVSRYSGRPHYAVGTSLCYRRDWWKAHPFQERGLQIDSASGAAIGEDNKFSGEAERANQLLCADSRALMVARIHAGNSSTKSAARYGPTKEELPQGFPR